MLKSGLTKTQLDVGKSQRKYLIQRILQMDLKKTHLGESRGNMR